jgi:D-3-phosphoglycerate dehydrogenase
MSPSTEKQKILISDKMSSEAVKILTETGEFEVDYKPDITPEELVREIGAYSALVIRSRTTVDKDVLAAAERLQVVGRAGVGVDNIDVPEATSRGIIVMNTPDGNTLSTAEHTFSMMLALARSIAHADKTMKEGLWEKKSITGVEMFAKTLGVCGLGRIGREVAKRARAFGMRVVGFDPYFSREAAEKIGVELYDNVDDVVAVADVLTVHTPLNDKTRGMIGAEQIRKAKPGVMIVNCARGGIVDEDALVEGLQSGKVGGAALDVFETEPPAADHPLRQMENVTLTPHLAASTTEAQEGVARDVANQIVDALRGTVVRNALNAPSIDAESLKRVRPYLALAESMGRFLSQIAPSTATRLDVEFSGGVAELPLSPITTAAVKGFFDPHASQPVNYVNAMHRAEERGMEIVESHTSAPGDFTSLIILRAGLEDGSRCEIAGTLFGHSKCRIVRVNGIDTEVNPIGVILMVENEDKPGVIGSVAVLLGRHGVNIAEMDLERCEPGGKALTFIQVDGEVEDAVLTELRALPNILTANRIVC